MHRYTCRQNTLRHEIKEEEGGETETERHRESCMGKITWVLRAGNCEDQVWNPHLSGAVVCALDSHIGCLCTPSPPHEAAQTVHRTTSSCEDRAFVERPLLWHQSAWWLPGTPLHILPLRPIISSFIQLKGWCVHSSHLLLFHYYALVQAVTQRSWTKADPI